MAIQIPPGERNPQRIVDAIRQLVEGRHNAGGTVTLTPNATTTVVSHPNCSRDSYVGLGAPQTLNAAGAVATTFVSSVDQGSFTITHANAGSTDRRFFYTVTGG